MKTGSRIVLAVLLCLGGVVVATGGPASAASLPGMVLSSTTATLPPELASLATGKRIQYVSTDVNGTLITATGLIMTPRSNKKNKTVAWAHGTTGLADQCAPSTNQNVFWPEARTAVAALLSKGWTVAAPDYPGLGTPQQHPYLIGASEARSIIDSVKAARNLDQNLSVLYAIDGHSQGGQGALFANQIAPSYDGNLQLRGTATIAPVSNVDALAPIIPGTPGQGYLVMGLYGLSAVDATFNPNTVLGTEAKAKTTVLTTGCLEEILAAYQDLTAEQLLIGGALPDPVVAELAHFDNPAQSAPSAPILIVQGTDDDAVPFFVTHDLLLPQLQAYSQPVQFNQISGATHDSAVVLSAGDVANWLAARLA
ncbi:alpha/beta fold hydrolase [Actinoplanes sp. CA-030573]|uniref:alpha/beta fold hydrolase n=1 Tax=Actinoplanes sp. CA-030573 TaxID=3239898 RepID=UPI003D94488B